MAVALTGTPSSASAVGGPISLTWSFNNNAAGNLMMVSSGGTDSPAGQHTSTVTYAGSGSGWSELSELDDGNFCATAVWSKNGSLATGANDVVITYVSTGAGERMGTASSFTGQHATTPLGTPVTKANTTDDPINVVVTDSVAGDIVYGAITTDSTTIVENGTLIAELENVGSDTAHGSQRHPGAASVTVEWNLAGALGGAVIAVAIKAAAGAVGLIHRKLLLGVGI